MRFFFLLKPVRVCVCAHARKHASVCVTFKKLSHLTCSYMLFMAAVNDPIKLYFAVRFSTYDFPVLSTYGRFYRDITVILGCSEENILICIS